MVQVNHGVVAAGHLATAEAGVEMLRLGGNAFDAAIAAILTSFVVESTLTSAGGAGFLLAHTASGQSTLFDFFSQTPQQQRSAESLDFYPIEANFGDTTQEFHVGLGSMAVPGNLAGALHVHRRLGRLSLSIIAEPAIHWAKTGVVLDDFRAYCIHLLEPILMATAGARSLYAPNGKLLQTGETLRMPNFAATLSHLVDVGLDEFYRGAIAQQIAQDCQTRGGHLTAQDLANYRVIERRPLVLPYRDITLLTNPPPSSGGALIAFALKLLAQADLTQIPPDSSAHLQRLAQVMRLTNIARRDGYDARLYEPDVAERFLTESHVAQYAAKLEAKLEPLNKWGSTTHISVLDQEGNAASVTTSNGEGSSYVVPGTDIMINNMLGEEDLNPNGFHQWTPNQRISSMMAPSILLKAGRPYAVLGSGGSNRIRTAILQVISNLVDFRQPVDLAVNRSRLHWERNLFHLEPGLELDEAAIALSPDEELIRWQQSNMFFGGVHTVVTDGQGGITGAGDHRRGGAIAQC